jgi:hypothetical protein
MRSVVGAGWLNVDQALSPIRILSSRGLQQSVRGGGGGPPPPPVCMTAVNMPCQPPSRPCARLSSYVSSPVSSPAPLNA